MLFLLACGTPFDVFPAPDAFTLSGPGGPTQNYSADQLYTPCTALLGSANDVEHHNLVGMVDGYLLMPWSPESGGGGISFFDVSDPCNPVKVGEAEAPHMRETHTLGIGVVDGRKYLATDMHIDGATGGIGFFDITDPTSPEWVSELTIPEYKYPDAYFRVALSTFWQGDRLYVAAGLSGIFTVDVSDPLNPVILDQHTEIAFLAGSTHIIGNIAMTSSAGLPKTMLWDLSDPDDWQLLADFNTVDFEGQLHPYYFASVGGKYGLYARKDGGGGPIVYDISDPTTPTLVGNAVAGDGDGGYVYRQKNVLFQGESNFAQLYTFDDPTAPEVIARIDMQGDVDTISPVGNVAFVSVDEKGEPGLATQVYPWTENPDTSAPAIELQNPADKQTNVALTSRIGVSFDEWIEPASVFEGSFRVWDQDGNKVPGRFYTQENLVNFVPDMQLSADTTYLVEIPAGGIEDISNNPIQSTLSWRFSTGSEVDTEVSP